MAEIYWGHSSQWHLTPYQLKKIKQNMQKLPAIQKKLQKIQDKDIAQAESALAAATAQIDSDQIQNENMITEIEKPIKLTWWKKYFQNIHNVIKKIFWIKSWALEQKH